MKAGSLLDFLKQVGTDAAQGALVILGQLVALVDVTADGAFKLLHIGILLYTLV